MSAFYIYLFFILTANDSQGSKTGGVDYFEPAMLIAMSGIALAVWLGGLSAERDRRKFEAKQLAARQQWQKENPGAIKRPDTVRR